MKYLKKFQLFNEAVGVPAGIVETAKSIYNDFTNLNFDDVFVVGKDVSSFFCKKRIFFDFQIST